MRREANGQLHANSYPRRFPTVGLTPPSTPYTINLTSEDGRFWFAVFDLDAKQPEDFAQACEDLGVLVRVLRDAEIPHVVCRSSSTGGFHVWVPLAGLEKPVLVQLSLAAAAVLPSLDRGLLCNDRTGAVRPPGSPHARAGASVVMEGDVQLLTEHTVTTADLQRAIAGFRLLSPTADPAEQPATGPVDQAHRPHRPLPAWGEAHMATVAGGADPSRTGYLCLLAAAVAGWTLSDVQKAVRTAPGLEHYRTSRNAQGGARVPRRPEEAAARLSRQWDKAVDRALWYRYAPQERADRDLSELEVIVATGEGMLQAFRVSPGRWAASEAAFHDAMVLTALGWLALRSGSRDTAAALRTIAGVTGIPSTTVDRTLRRLQQAGWVTRTRTSEGLDAAVWRVSDRFSTADRQDGPLHDVTARPPSELFDARAVLLREFSDRIDAGRHDLFTRGGLGPTARRVYEALTTVESPVEDVAARAGVPRGRVLVALARLRRFRLATALGGWRRRAKDFRDWAAGKLGLGGVLRRRELRMEREREVWAWWQNHLARKAGRPGRERTGASGQTLIFQLVDDVGGPGAWPTYPTHPDGSGDHRTAWRFVKADLLQQIRDTELIA
ncbi:hypothetical protein ACIPY5_19980 [Microbacterium sp. NPDC089698]|uniref:hypothetical protein n=1 Tax=Microbacterium sp. NPDC089698 TaxID=3364200 RepID=UPI0038119076